MSCLLIFSVCYMSPERNDVCGYHFKSDIWSLGCMLYEMCNFRSPFSGETNNAYALHKRIKTGAMIPFASDKYSRLVSLSHMYSFSLFTFTLSVSIFH